MTELTSHHLLQLLHGALDRSALSTAHHCDAIADVAYKLSPLLKHATSSRTDSLSLPVSFSPSPFYHSAAEVVIAPKRNSTPRRIDCVESACCVMLIIAGHVFVAPSELKDFIADARSTLPLGRAAEGNLFFSFTVDDEAEGSVTVLERWRDRASLDAYLALPEVVAIFTRWGGRMRNEVRLYDASNERSPRG